MSQENETLEFQPFELKEDLELDKSLFENLVEKEILTEEESTGVAEAYEAAVRSSVKKILEESINPHYEEQLETIMEETKEDLAEELSNYMDYVVEEFVEENQEQIQVAETSKQDRALVEGLVGLFEEHYIDIPEGRQDIVESLSSDLKDANSELEEAEDQIIELRSKLNGMACEKAFEQAAADLSESQKERLMSLVEDLSIDKPEEFEKKVGYIKENMIDTSSNNSGEDDLDDKLNEDLNSHSDHDRVVSTGLDWMDEALAVTRKTNTRKRSAV